MCLSRDCGLVSLGHPLGTGVVRKAPARDVLMVLGVAVAWTPLAVLVSSTIFINISFFPQGPCTPGDAGPLLRSRRRPSASVGPTSHAHRAAARRRAERGPGRALLVPPRPRRPGAASTQGTSFVLRA